MTQPTLRQELDALFARSGFDERSYDENWLKVDAGPIPIRLPQGNDIKKLLPLHDLHHVVTGYDTDVVGEYEVAAWEIGSGVSDLEVWTSNLAVMGTGLLEAPRRTWRAFARGRKEHNLYERDYDGLDLEQPLEAMRAELGILDQTSEPTVGDRFALAALGPAILASMALAVVALPVFAVASAYDELRAKRADAEERA